MPHSVEFSMDEAFVGVEDQIADIVFGLSSPKPSFQKD